MRYVHLNILVLLLLCGLQVNVKTVHESWGRTRPACGLTEEPLSSQRVLSSRPHAGRVRPQGQRFFDQGLDFERLLFAQASINVCAQRTEQELSIAKKKVESQELQLTTTIDNFRYCADDNDLDTFRMTLKLRFKNNGSKTIILYKESNTIHDYLVNNNNLNILDVHQAILFNNEGIAFNEESYKKLFVTLPKNSIYETSAQITIPVVKNDGKVISGAIGSGKYTLQIKVSTWLEPSELAKELRDKWEARGILWYEPIWSLPMSFEIIRNRRAINCN